MVFKYNDELMHALTNTGEVLMSDREIILSELMDVLGEEGCGVSCEEASVYQDDDGWKMMLQGFMEL